MLEEKKHLERVLRECAELGVPESADPWPEIKERATGEQISQRRTGEEQVGAGPQRHSRLPQLVPDTLLGWTLAILSVLILGAGVYATSGPVRDLFLQGMPGPAGPGVEAGPDGGPGEMSNVNEERAVREVVESFGERLKAVTLSAPNKVAARQIREQYGALVTPELLEWWTTNLRAAPGREVSSPWPEEIEVKEVRRVEGDLFRVEGDVVYMSSYEMANGGDASRERVVLSVSKGQDGKWRISDYWVVRPPRE